MSNHNPDRRNSHAWKQLRKQILAASDICWMCGKPGADTVDHLVPKARGGTDTVANLRPAHGRRQPWGCPGNYARGAGHVDVNNTTRDW